MKEEWFNYVLENKNLWPNGWTIKRLNNIKDNILCDSRIMYDLLERHGGNKVTPEEMKKESKELFDHCISNFVHNIHYKMIELKLT